MITASTLSFLKLLKKNNNKPWFDANKSKYLDARNNFEQFVAPLLQKMALFDEDLKELEYKNCLFRINRDVRFSKDKTPYKINFSASFNKGGKKNQFMPDIIFMFSRAATVLLVEDYGGRSRSN